MSRAAVVKNHFVSDSLSNYFDDIGRYRLLSRWEERDLGRRIRKGDRDALDALVCANLRFVVSIAKTFQGRPVPLMDLVSAGNLGLLRAARTFDETKGVKFISYAVWWIRRAILQALAEQSRIVRLPSHQTAKLRWVARRANVLLQELGREPTRGEIADGMDTSEEEVATAMSISQAALSFDAPMTPGEDNNLLDYLPDTRNLPPDEQTFEKALTQSIEEALSRLNGRESKILRLYFGFDGEEPMTLEQIGSLLGVTRERVRQVRDRALRRLRKSRPDLALAG
jgi:RNA polymerase primary sigma factor